MAVEGAIAPPHPARPTPPRWSVAPCAAPSPRGVRADDSERATERLYRYAVRLVGSCLATSVEPDEGATADAIKRKLTREGSATAAVKFAELHRRLAQQPGLKAQWATLHALLRVSEDRRAEDRAVVPAGGGIGAGAATARPSRTRSLRRRRGRAPALADPDPARSLARATDRRSGSTTRSRALAYRELAAEAETNLEIGEQELVRDALRVPGIDGRHIRYNPRITPSSSIPPTGEAGEGLAGKLTELGWLFRRVRAALGGVDEAVGGGGVRAGGATPSLGNIEAWAARGSWQGRRRGAG